MTSTELKVRTKKYAVSILNMLKGFRKEGNEILSIIVASINTAKRRLNESKK